MSFKSSEVEFGVPFVNLDSVASAEADGSADAPIERIENTTLAARAIGIDGDGDLAGFKIPGIESSEAKGK